MRWAFVVTVMFVSLSFMGCLTPDDKRTVIEENPVEVTRLVVTEEELSQFPYSDNPIRNFSVVDPSSIILQFTLSVIEISISVADKIKELSFASSKILDNIGRVFFFSTIL